MRTITYPSAAFPGPPRIDLDLPEGWAPLRLAGVLMAAREVSAPTGFASNVVVKGYLRDITFDVGQLIRELTSFAAAKPEGAVDEPFRVTVGETSWIGVNVSWQDPDVGQVLQVHLLAGLERGSVLDLVHMVGAVGGGDVGAAYQGLHDVMTTVRVSR